LLWAIVIAEGVLMLLIGVLVVSLLRGYAEVLGALAQVKSAAGTLNPLVVPPRNAPISVSDVVGRTVEGDAVKVGVARRTHDTLLAFLSSGCSTCKSFWKAMSSDQLRSGVPTRLLIVTHDAEEESPSTIRELRSDGMDVVMSSRAWEDYGVPGSPYFIHVGGPDSKVLGEGSAVSWEEVVAMFQQSAGDAAEHVTEGGSSAVAVDLLSAPNGRDDDDRMMAALASAGITPGHHSLWPSQAMAADGSGASDEKAPDGR
jgi:hypothetical protein